jgi:hypothetical protein
VVSLDQTNLDSRRWTNSRKKLDAPSMEPILSLGTITIESKKLNGNN